MVNYINKYIDLHAGPRFIKHVTCAELLRFFAILIYRGLFSCPHIRDYWAKDPTMPRHPDFGIGKHRFETIHKYFQACDPDDEAAAQRTEIKDVNIDQMIVGLRSIASMFMILRPDEGLVFAEEVGERTGHGGKVLDISVVELREAQELLDVCKFYGHTICKNGIKMSAGHVKVIRDWPGPTSTKHDQPFVWTDDQERAFTSLKHAITSIQLSSAERNYQTHEQELLAVCHALHT
ncbi:hypothetical protein BGW42_008130 [Actinomortierella wolfii]|nr:hypothetical protein BGW42_008130 [Actinomortierella wolfii]